MKHSITKELKKSIPAALAVLLLAGMVALNVFVPEPVTEPDAEYPMANVNVSWSQTFYGGAWSDD